MVALAARARFIWAFAAERHFVRPTTTTGADAARAVTDQVQRCLTVAKESPSLARLLAHPWMDGSLMPQPMAASMRTATVMLLLPTRGRRYWMRTVIVWMILGMPVVAALLPAPAWSQNAVRIAGGPTCPQCKLKTTLIATLGKASDPHLLSSGSLALRDSRGWFYSNTDDPGKILVFGLDGGYVSALGAPGNGPGEFRSITTLTVDPGDTLHLFGQRESLFLRNGTFVRTRAIPGVTDVTAAIAYGGGITLLQGGAATRERFGDPFHLVGVDGSIRRSFGLAANEQVREARVSGRRRIADVGDGTFWSARLNQYVLERWDTAGRLLRTITRVTPWFEMWDPAAVAQMDPYTTPPKPTVIGISMSCAGFDGR